jgi:hypothetical protein
MKQTAAIVTINILIYYRRKQYKTVLFYPGRRRTRIGRALEVAILDRTTKVLQR